MNSIWRNQAPTSRNRFKWLPNFSGTSRIPITLQNIFLSSNRGEDVRKAPPGNVANKNFADLEESDTGSDNDNMSVDSYTVSEEVEFIHPVVRDDVAPQKFLDDMLSSRGYSISKRKTLDTGYYAKPTELQNASYNQYLSNLARNGKIDKLRKIMECGISTNPCNAYGESLIHLVSRCCSPETLQVLLDAGASLQVSDDYGRTPLHDACWRAQPCFEIVEKIAGFDINFFLLADQRGSTPLAYVHRHHWEQFNAFLDSKKDEWWPEIHTKNDDSVINASPNSWCIPNPPNALKSTVASMVVAGRLSPTEARMLMEEEDNDIVDDDEDESDDDDSEYDSDDSEYDSEDDDDDYDMSDDEMEEMMAMISTAGGARQ